MHLLTSNNFHNTKIYPFSKKTSWKGGGGELGLRGLPYKSDRDARRKIQI